MTNFGGSLDITILAVSDLLRSHTFYRLILDAEIAVETPIYVELQTRSGARLGLYWREGFARNVGAPPPSVSEGAITATELYLKVPDLSAAIARLEASGGRLLAPRAEKDWGDEVAYFADPDGNVVALAERAKSAAKSYAHDPALYDAIYQFKGYAAEAKRIRAILDDAGVPPGSRVLDAACGTGAHLVHLQDSYAVSGFDLSPEMIEGAEKKLPGAQLFVADMCDFALAEPIDAILCLFGAIGYVYFEERLQHALDAFARALRPSGILLLEPWLTDAEFHEGRMTLQTFERDDLKIARAVVSKKDGALSILDFHWTVMRQGLADVEQFTTHHRLWLCPTERLLEALGRAGFDCRFEREGLMPGRSLIIGRRRP